MAFVLLELAYVLLAVWPDQMTIPVHLVVQPVPFVLFVVRPNVDTLALDFIHVEFSLIHRSVSKCKFSCSVLFPFRILALVDRTIWPGFKAKSMLFIVLPLSDILCAIRVRIGAFAVCFIVQPISFVNISIGMVQLSMTICFSELPLPFIKRAVWPSLFPHAISETV